MPEPPAGPDDVLVVGPDPGRARAWAGLALVLVAVTVALAVTAEDAVLEWIGAGVAVALAAAFVVPVVAPHLTQVELDRWGVRGRSYHATLEVPWDVVQVARVVRVVGETVLEVHVRVPSATGDPWRTRAVGLLLPIGADVAALEAFLARRPRPLRSARGAST